MAIQEDEDQGDDNFKVKNNPALHAVHNRLSKEITVVGKPVSGQDHQPENQIVGDEEGTGRRNCF